MKVALFDIHGKPVYLLGISEDITEKKEIQKKLELEKAKSLHTAKLATIGELTAGVAHEISNPLSIIVGSAHLLSQQKNDVAMVEASCQQILKSSDRIMGIIKSLKRFSRSTEVKDYKVHKLSSIIQEAFIIMNSKAKSNAVKLELTMHDDVEVLCDEIEMEQVVINLLNNGIDAARESTEKWVRMTIQYKGEEPTLIVSDSGGGISPENQEKLFNPFFTTKKVGEGTGLGLSISKGILDLHGASITLLKNEKNTSFEIRFLANLEHNNGNC